MAYTEDDGGNVEMVPMRRLMEMPALDTGMMLAEKPDVFNKPENLNVPESDQLRYVDKSGLIFWFGSSEFLNYYFIVKNATTPRRMNAIQKMGQNLVSASRIIDTTMTMTIAATITPKTTPPITAPLSCDTAKLSNACPPML